MLNGLFIGTGSYRYTTRLVFSVVYGYKITSEDDVYLRIAKDFMEISARAITDIWVVDLLPFR